MRSEATTGTFLTQFRVDFLHGRQPGSGRMNKRCSLCTVAPVPHRGFSLHDRFRAGSGTKLSVELSARKFRVRPDSGPRGLWYKNLIRFCFLALTDHQATKPYSFPFDPLELNSNHILIFAFGQKVGGLGRVGFELTTIGLKVRISENKRLVIQPLTGKPVATYARLCITAHNW